MKKILTVLFAVPLVLSVTACDPFGLERSRQVERDRIEREDRLYDDCLAAGGSFSRSNDGWGLEYACAMPGGSGNIDVEVNADTKE